MYIMVLHIQHLHRRCLYDLAVNIRILSFDVVTPIKGVLNLFLKLNLKEQAAFHYGQSPK